MACDNLPRAIAPSGTKTYAFIPALAAYAAAEAEVFPVEAHMTARLPDSRAFDTANVMPRSLNEPVGLSPSYLKNTSMSPTMSFKFSAFMRGVLPSLKVVIAVSFISGRWSLNSLMRPCHRLLFVSFAKTNSPPHV